LKILNENQELVEKLIQYIEKNEEKWYRVAYYYARDQEVAMDIVQEAITKALTKISSIKQAEFMKTWFYRILINTAIDEAKRNKKNSTFCLEDYLTEAMEEDFTTNIQLYEKINNLKPKLKTVILLRFFEDLKLSEIAQVTKTNENTVKSRLYQALNQLKVEWEEKEE
jgi:RNA polymerase sigma-70 factor (ECF subfamily)